jgi:uncharacterized protein YndB with AHSA1/START domain
MAASQDHPVFETTRHFKHPRHAVWKAWSDPKQVQAWWGPKGCAIEVLRFEFRPGGFFHYAMTMDGQPPMWGRFAFREIAEPQRIVWLNSFANERCGIARAPFSEYVPLEIENTVTFTEHAGVTTLKLRAEAFGELAEERAFFAELCATSLQEGYGGTFEQLAEHLART